MDIIKIFKDELYFFIELRKYLNDKKLIEQVDLIIKDIGLVINDLDNEKDFEIEF